MLRGPDFVDVEYGVRDTNIRLLKLLLIVHSHCLVVPNIYPQLYPGNRIVFHTKASFLFCSDTVRTLYISSACEY